MLQLGNGGTQAIKSTEGTNEGKIMNKRVLMRKVEPINLDTAVLEYDLIPVKSGKNIL
jgi:hypothetical protein